MKHVKSCCRCSSSNIIINSRVGGRIHFGSLCGCVAYFMSVKRLSAGLLFANLIHSHLGIVDSCLSLLPNFRSTPIACIMHHRMYRAAAWGRGPTSHTLRWWRCGMGNTNRGTLHTLDLESNERRIYRIMNKEFVCRAKAVAAVGVACPVSAI